MRERKERESKYVRNICQSASNVEGFLSSTFWCAYCETPPRKISVGLGATAYQIQTPETYAVSAQSPPHVNTWRFGNPIVDEHGHRRAFGRCSLAARLMSSASAYSSTLRTRCYEDWSWRSRDEELVVSCKPLVIEPSSNSSCPKLAKAVESFAIMSSRAELRALA